MPISEPIQELRCLPSMGSYGDGRKALFSLHVRHEVIDFICKARTWRRRHPQLSMKAQPFLCGVDEVASRLSIAPCFGIRALLLNPHFCSLLDFFQADFS